jgi:hypothetical protein
MGHAGGDAEALAVEEWAARLRSDAFEAQKIAFQLIRFAILRRCLHSLRQWHGT